MIRSAEVKDIDKINELGMLITDKFIKLFNMDEILKEGFSKVFVYEIRGEVVAFLHITELYEIVDIVNIVVKKQHRSKGIASLLIDYMISDIDSKAELITLEVAVDNERAIALYKKFGFEVINTRNSYYEHGDAYVMGRKLLE